MEKPYIKADGRLPGAWYRDDGVVYVERGKIP